MPEYSFCALADVPIQLCLNANPYQATHNAAAAHLGPAGGCHRAPNGVDISQANAMVFFTEQEGLFVTNK